MSLKPIGIFGDPRIEGSAALDKELELIKQSLGAMSDRPNVLSRLYLEIGGINKLSPNIVARVIFDRVLTEAEREEIKGHRTRVLDTRHNLLVCDKKLSGHEGYRDLAFREWIDSTNKDVITLVIRLFGNVSSIGGRVEDILYDDQGIHEIPDREIMKQFADAMRKASLILLFGERVPAIG